mmetsp:Transcript_20575/g.37137  ORF Transcript_20575/g.37137 Transcript_20575/m.37137 type:complete len:362 (-) Transcript_20575:823-1908(-)
MSFAGICTHTSPSLSLSGNVIRSSITPNTTRTNPRIRRANPRILTTKDVLHIPVPTRRPRLLLRKACMQRLGPRGENTTRQYGKDQKEYLQGTHVRHCMHILGRVHVIPHPLGIGIILLVPIVPIILQVDIAHLVVIAHGDAVDEGAGELHFFPLSFAEVALAEGAVALVAVGGGVEDLLAEFGHGIIVYCVVAVVVVSVIVLVQILEIDILLLARKAHGSFLPLIHHVQRSMPGVIPILESVIIKVLPNVRRNVTPRVLIAVFIGINAQRDGESILGAVWPDIRTVGLLALEVLRDIIIECPITGIGEVSADAVIKVSQVSMMLMHRGGRRVLLLEVLILECTAQPAVIILTTIRDILLV